MRKLDRVTVRNALHQCSGKISGKGVAELLDMRPTTLAPEIKAPGFFHHAGGILSGAAAMTCYYGASTQASMPLKRKTPAAYSYGCDVINLVARA
jgi:hypothetical protein